jgi:PAS domain S-box-containing protein
MDKKKATLINGGRLRRRAEEQLGKDSGANQLVGTGEDLRLRHELQVHQIELEMQNEELRQARDEAETTLERYTDLYDFAPVGYFTLNREGIIHGVNLTGASLLGVERSLLLGRRFGLFVANEARPAFNSFFEKAITGPTKEECEVALLAEGDLPRFVHIEGMAASSGEECRIALIDITERKWLEDLLRDKEKQFRLQVECVANYAIFMLDAQGNILNWNAGAERLKGYRAEEIVGKHFSFFYTGEDRAGGKPAEELKKAAAEGQVEVAGWRVRKDGSRFWADVIITALRDENGNLKGFTKVTHDITERREMEEKVDILHDALADHAAELEAVNIELEAFNFTVSHDLRKPLTIINSCCQVVVELCGNSLDEECRGYLRDMYESTLRMNRLIDTLLNFSRITRVGLCLEKVDLSSMAEEVAMTLKATAPERCTTFRIAAGITADGDKSLLRVVLDNLIGNAWKFTGNREDTVIEFGATEVAGQQACLVRDNGPGFDVAHADELFTPFQRLPGTDVEGDGIGLATVDRIVRRHGGRVWAESEPGKGATFYFTLRGGG